MLFTASSLPDAIALISSSKELRSLSKRLLSVADSRNCVAASSLHQHLRAHLSYNYCLTEFSVILSSRILTCLSIVTPDACILYKHA
jgi:hypothetical protein